MFERIARAIFGAFRLARLDPGGMAFFERTREGAAHSFVAALLILPPYVVLTSLDFLDVRIVDPVRVLAVEGIAYVIGWAAFPVLMLTVAPLLGRGHRYFDLVVAYNWSAVVQISVYLPVGLLVRLGGFSEGVAGALFFAAALVLTFYEAFIMRVALDLERGPAALLAIGEFMLGTLIGRVADGMLAAGIVSLPG